MKALSTSRNLAIRSSAIALAQSLLIFQLLWGECASSPAASSAPAVTTKPAGATYDVGWPRIFPKDDYTVTIFQPQVESWDGFNMNLTAAVSLHSKDAKEPDFGAIKVKASVFIDKVERTVHFVDIEIASAMFPAAPPGKKDTFLKILTPLIKDQIKSVSLDRIEAQLAILDAQTKGNAVPVENPVPAFIFATTPAILITIQGEPMLRPVGDTGVQRVINTQAFIAKGPAGNYFLHLWDGFVTADSLTGNWTVARNVPDGITAAEKAAVKDKLVDLLGGRSDPKTGKTPSLVSASVPTIHVATQPTELIQFEGSGEWTPLQGTNLLDVSNTVSNVFMDMNDQQTYVLVSGRWFKAASMQGPWTYVAPKDLPGDFAKIPATGSKENVLACVPGTSQARQALIAAQIPQMAKVNRAATKLPPLKFDGMPEIKPIEGTSLKYVANCTVPVIELDATNWYVVNNAIWFTARDVGGPWIVADSIPAAIYSIPPSSPLHYVTYVKVYSKDATDVWFGYTPGYYGAVVGPDNIVVYGTGYSYPAYVGTTSYIPAPVTYGYNATMAWTPAAGWAFGFAAGWALGSAHDDYWCTPPPCPAWGPYYSWSSGEYHNGYCGTTAWGAGGWAATSGNMYAQCGNWNATYHESAGYNAYTGTGGASQYGHAYNSETGTMAVGSRSAEGNVYTGNYAAHSEATAYNPYSGKSAEGGKTTVGNAYSGNSATAGHVSTYNPATGKTNYAAGVHGEQGGAYDVNGNTFATHDGQVYKPSSSGGYDHYNSSGSWDHVQDSNMNKSLSNTHSSQLQGEQRSQSWQSHGFQDDRLGGGGRSFGGGGWGGGGRSFGGGGRSFGGGGRSFGGFRR